MKLHILTPLIGIILFGSHVTCAQDSKSSAGSPMVVSKVWLYPNYQETKPPVAGMGDTIVVEVNNLEAAVNKNEVNSRNFVLYLNGEAVKGVTAVPIGAPSYNQLAFKLKRTAESSQTWSNLLGK